MYNKRFIIPGVILFVAACTFPFWINAGSGSYVRPALEKPANATECIEPLAVMQSEHMRILIEWRDAAVRDGKRSYVAADGKIWEASLQNTCMKCHTDRQAFCGACHDANSVRPDCWTCHIAPETVKTAGTKPDATPVARGKLP